MSQQVVFGENSQNSTDSRRHRPVTYGLTREGIFFKVCPFCYFQMQPNKHKSIKYIILSIKSVIF
uniref:Uncharacterized protein n=1 Tax=Peromyscus maniculatus bairdii TaxID=230844 RepID=A0A8C8W760_PERMB